MPMHLELIRLLSEQNGAQRNAPEFPLMGGFPGGEGEPGRCEESSSIADPAKGGNISLAPSYILFR